MPIGFHVARIYATGTRNNIENHIEKATQEVYKSKVFQIYISGPKKMKIIMTDEQLDSLREYIELTNIYVIAHGTYLDVPFHNPSKYVINFVQKELEACHRSGIKGLVIHLSNHDISHIVEVLSKLNVPNDVTLFLETPAMKPYKSKYHNIDDIINLMHSIKHMRVGICIDIAHLHASGNALSTKQDTEEFFNKLIKHVDTDKILIHLNDDSNRFASGKDFHQILTRGEIWKDFKHGNIKNSGLYSLLHYIKKYNLLSIIELEDPLLLKEVYSIVENVYPHAHF